MWQTIKKILQKQKGTCIIVEEGKPAYVVTNFEDFQRLVEEKEMFPLAQPTSNLSEQELLEKINQEITNWKAAQAEEQSENVLTENLENEVKIEDLPI